MRGFPKFLTAVFFAFSLTFFLACGGGDTAEMDEAAGDETSATADQAAGEGPTGTASISGTINYEGDVPNLRPIDMSAEPQCANKHEGQVMPNVLVLGEGNTMANVLVRVTGGLPEGTWSPPSEPVTMDQEGCEYIPHVLGIMAGQKFRILNSDGVLHNVHALPDKNAEFNMAMPASRTEAERAFDQPEDPFRIKCDVHPWMGAYVAVLSHPFYAVTDKDGSFEISDLPAGTYEIEAWHERLGTQSASVTVGDGESATSDFTFSR